MALKGDSGRRLCGIGGLPKCDKAGSADGSRTGGSQGIDVPGSSCSVTWLGWVVFRQPEKRIRVDAVNEILLDPNAACLPIFTRPVLLSKGRLPAVRKVGWGWAVFTGANWPASLARLRSETERV